MAIEQMLRQRARIDRAVPEVAPDGTVSRNWELVVEAAPCLLEKTTSADGLACVARGYFSLRGGLPAPGTGGRQLRILVDGQVWFVREVYRMGGGEGRRPELLAAELES